MIRLKEKLRLCVSLLLLSFFLLSCAARGPELQQAEKLFQEGRDLKSKGAHEAAFGKFNQSYELSKKGLFRAGMARNLSEMAEFHFSIHDFRQARKLLSEAFLIYSQEGLTMESSQTLDTMAQTYIQEENYPGAIKQYEDLIIWDRRTNNLLGVAITMNNMGLVYEKFLNRPQMAQRSYLEALAIFKQHGHSQYIALMEENLKRIR